FFVPLGLKAWFAGQGIRTVSEHDWGDEAQFRDLKLTLVPAPHWQERPPWDRDSTLWGGWVIEQPSFRFFFAGDTGYSADFKDIGQRFGFFHLGGVSLRALVA